MACLSLVVIASLLSTGSQACTPILWAEARGFLGRHSESYVLPQKLCELLLLYRMQRLPSPTERAMGRGPPPPKTGRATGHEAHNEDAAPSSNGTNLNNEVPMLPYFTDKAISVAGWCIEASGAKSGDAVVVKNCDGLPIRFFQGYGPHARSLRGRPFRRIGRHRKPRSAPRQQRNQIPNGHVQNMIQLKDTALCVSVNEVEGSSKQASVELQPCEKKAAEAWTYEAPLSVPAEVASFAADVRHVIGLAGIGALGLSAWFWQCHSKTRALGGGIPSIVRLEGGVALPAPMLIYARVGRPAPSPMTRRGGELSISSDPSSSLPSLPSEPWTRAITAEVQM